MPKQSNFQPRQNHKQELKRLVKNFNAKLSRIEKKSPELMEFMPEKVKVSVLNKKIASWNDYQTITGQLRRFLKKGVEEVQENKLGERATKYAIREYKRDQAYENKKKEQRIKKAEETPETKGGKPTGQSKAQMKSKEEVRNLKDTKSFDEFKPGEFKERSKLFANKRLDSYELEQMKRMQENYIKGLIREGYPEGLQRLVARVPTEKFVEIAESDVFANFDFIYDRQQLAAKAEQLMHTWTPYAEKRNNTGIKVISIQRVVEFERLGEYLYAGFRNNHGRK